MKMILTIDIPKHLKDDEMRASVIRTLSYVGRSIDGGADGGTERDYKHNTRADWKIEESPKNPNLLTSEQTENVCKPEELECCSYLVVSPEGLECAKGTSVEAELKRRREAKTMRELGDNCTGPAGGFMPLGETHECPGCFGPCNCSQPKNVLGKELLVTRICIHDCPPLTILKGLN